MRRILILIMGLFVLSSVYGQQSLNLVIFSEDSDKFTLYLNGVQKNEEPQANVKLTGLESNTYKARLVFESGSIPEIKKNLFFENMGEEYSFAVVKKNNGKYKLRFMSRQPISQTASAADNAQNSEDDYETPSGANTGTSQTSIEGSGTTVHSTTSTSTGSGESVSMNVQMNEDGVSMDVNTGEESVNASFSIDDSNATTTTTSTTHTTTVTHSGTHQITDEASWEEESTTQSTSSYSGNCPTPISESELSEIQNSIKSKDFEDTKLIYAKQVIKNKCLSAKQIKSIMELFDFEETRLEIAKYAYGYCYDPDNYFVLNDAFDFEMSIEELNEYLEKRQ